MSQTDISPAETKPLVFVVDDEPMLLDVAAAILKPQFQIRTFSSGEAALAAFTAEGAPALVLTDYAMHPMTGLELIRECRRLRPRQKIILLSGTVDESVYADSSAKPDLFLAKPYTPRQLISLIQSLLAS
jgi:CheY-like chemotaxis protein